MTDKPISLARKEEAKKIAAELQMDALHRLESIVHGRNAEDLFTAVLFQLSLPSWTGPPSEVKHGTVPAKLELLAFHLYPRFGSGEGSLRATFLDVAQCSQALEDLFEAGWLLPNLENLEEPFILSEIRRNAEVVRGSAYPEQTATRIIEVQGAFDGWFRKRLGVGPKRAQEIVWAIVRAQERNSDRILTSAIEAASLTEESWREAKSKPVRQLSSEEKELLASFQRASDAQVVTFSEEYTHLASRDLPVGREDLSDLDEIPSVEEWSGIKRLIGLTTESRMKMSSPLEIKQRSLFFLPDEQVLLAELPSHLDNLWEGFEGEARKDSRFWSRYLDRRTKWSESKVAEILRQVFPASTVYQNLSYPDPDYTEGRTAELDFAVLWGPVLVLIETKAGQFRLRGQVSDPGRLQTDLKKNIEDAFEQARRAVRYIEREDSATFKEVSGERRLTVRGERIRRTYLLSISLHNFGTVATRLASLRELGLFKDGEYPLAISIADLEVVSKFCEGPDVLLHYIERRLALQRDTAEIFADELVLFGAYLDTRLQIESLSLHAPFAAMLLLGYSEQFDLWMSHQRGELAETEAPEIHLKVPQEIGAILKELRRSHDDIAKWIAFSILDLPDSALEAMADGLRELRKERLTPGMFRRAVWSTDDIVISVVGAQDQSLAQLQERTQLRAVIEKYRRRVSKSIGIGVMVLDSSRPFHCVVWGESPWKEDPVLEKLLQEEPLVIPVPNAKLPGRNDLCFCGSGKKFKKCHLPRMKSVQNPKNAESG